MFNSINFIKERRKLLSKKRQKDKKIFFYSIGVFALIFLVSLGLVASDVVVNRQVKNKLKLQEKLNQILNQSKSTRLSYQLNIKKLKLAAKLFNERKNKQEAVNYFSNLFDPEVRISSISYDATKKTLSFSLYIPSVFKLDEVLKILDSDEVTSRVSNLERSGISRSSDGSYSLSIKVFLNENNNFN